MAVSSVSRYPILPMKQQRPLVVVNNHNSLTLIKICADAAALGHDIGPITVSTAPHLEKSRHALTGLGIAISWDGENKPQMAANTIGTHPRATAWIRHALVAVADNLSLGQYAREWNIRRKLKAAHRRAAALFEECKPTVVLSMSDRNHDYIESSILLEARRRGIPIILPYVAHYDLKGALGYRRDVEGRILPEYAPHNRPTLYKLLAAHRLRHTLYEGVFFQHAFLLNAHRKNGTLSSFPWWHGNGLSDIVCVNSQHSYDTYLRQHVPAGKLRVMGDIFYDTLFALHGRRKQLREDLIGKYGLNPQRKLIVLAMPQYMEQGYFEAARHWTEIERILTSLCAQGADVLISLHPRMKPDDYRHLPGKFACRIADERLAAILPAADLFVSHYSSTVEWAVLCGISAVVVNALEEPLALFDHLTSVNVVKPAGLAAAVERALTQPVDFTHDWQELSRDELFDGNTAERYWQLFQSASS